MAKSCINSNDFNLFFHLVHRYPRVAGSILKRIFLSRNGISILLLRKTLNG